MTDLDGEPADAKTAIEDKGIAWFVRMRGEVDANLQSEFDHWYAALPEHQRAYQWAAAHFGASAALKKSTEVEPVRHRRSRYGLMAGAAVAAALLLTFGLQISRTAFSDNSNVVYAEASNPLATAAREIRTWRLSDGSRVTLDADSRLEVAMTSGERRFRLRQGRARFSVAREKRPFIVEAAVGAVTTDQGVFDMAFDRDRPERVTVNVISGRANMRGLIQPAVYMISGRALVPGKPVFYPADSFVPAPATGTGNETRDWPDGWVEYRSIALKDLVAQANLYSDRRIVIDDPEVGDIAASGRFKLTDTEAFKTRIAEALDLSVKQDANGIHLVRR